MNNRTLDALIAEHVFGCKKFIYDDEPDIICCGCDDYEAILLHSAEASCPIAGVKHYPTQIQDAWLVVDKMCGSSYFDLRYTDKIVWYGFAKIGVVDIASVTNESAPLAICLAALKALGVEVPNE